MSALVDFLFPAPARRSTAAIFRWWEARRLHYNIIVGLTGVFTLGMVQILSVLPPGPSSNGPPLEAVIVYGIAANVCYCTGPLLESLVVRVWRYELLPVGPMLFRAGLTFSFGLTLLPVAIFTFDWLTRLLRWIV